MESGASLFPTNQVKNSSLKNETDFMYAKAEEEKLIRNLKRIDRERLQIMLRLMRIGRMLEQAGPNKR